MLKFVNSLTSWAAKINRWTKVFTVCTKTFEYFCEEMKAAFPGETIGEALAGKKSDDNAR